MAIKPSTAVKAVRPKVKQPAKAAWAPKGSARGAARMQQVQMAAYMQGKAAAFKGAGKGGKGMKGMRFMHVPVAAPVPKPLNKWAEKMKKIDKSKLVWVGGLSPKTSWKTLEKHFREVVKPKLSDIIKKPGSKENTAKIAFNSEEDVATVVAALNGSELDGKVIEVDVWQKSDKPEKGEKKTKRKSKVSKVVNTKFAKASKAAKKPRNEKILAKLKEIEPSCKVWVGGLAEKTTWKALEKHFAEVIKPKVTDIMGKGKAVVAYESEGDVADVIVALNGSKLDGKTLEVDTWVKPERKERKPKDGKKDD